MFPSDVPILRRNVFKSKKWEICSKAYEGEVQIYTLMVLSLCRRCCAFIVVQVYSVVATIYLRNDTTALQERGFDGVDENVKDFFSEFEFGVMRAFKSPYGQRMIDDGCLWRILSPGEGIYFPPGYHHRVVNLHKNTISVGYFIATLPMMDRFCHSLRNGNESTYLSWNRMGSLLPSLLGVYLQENEEC